MATRARKRTTTAKKTTAKKTSAKGAKTGAAKSAGKSAVRAVKAARPVTKPAKSQFGSTKSAAAKRHPTKVVPIPSAVARLRQICLALPETSEVEAWGEPTFRVKGKIFAMHASAGTHHGDRPAVWILSVSLEQDLVLRARPDRYFKPPYVGPSGWIGAWLDRNPPWAEIEELVRDGWRRRAPKKLAALVAD